MYLLERIFTISTIRVHFTDTKIGVSFFTKSLLGNGRVNSLAFSNDILENTAVV